MNKIQIEDCKRIGDLDFIDWDRFKKSTILITGSTGLVGTNLVNALAFNSKKKGLDIDLVLPVRNPELSREMFEWTGAKIIPYELGKTLGLDCSVDYIVHLASPTDSLFFVERPVDTMLTNIEGTRALLEWAEKQQIKKFIYLSTMEVYGFPKKGHVVKENELGAFETMNERNSYPVAKIACEALCNAYFSQYEVPAVVLRATQTFGPGVKYDDGRVFAQLMRCVVEKKDIVLKTAGLTERSYLYIADTVSAILLSMLEGLPGESYSVANPDTYCSIREMAEMVANEIANGEIKVLYSNTEDIKKTGFAETLYMDMDISKIRALGWMSTVGLKEMFERMIAANGCIDE